MQWNNDRYQQPKQDVYSDIETSASKTAEENTDFSMDEIELKLGVSATTESADISDASPDVMPSSQTLSMSYHRDYSATKTHIASKLSTKEKVMVASYAFVVLLLILAVTLCAVSVSNSFGTAILSSAEYLELSKSVEQLTAQSQMENFEDLDRRATELGYIDASRSNTMNYTELETRPAQNFSVESNWFDSLCDWFSSVFGG